MRREGALFASAARPCAARLDGSGGAGAGTLPDDTPALLPAAALGTATPQNIRERRRRSGRRVDGVRRRMRRTHCLPAASAGSSATRHAPPGPRRSPAAVTGPWGQGWPPAKVPPWVIQAANLFVFIRTVPAYQIYRWGRGWGGAGGSGGRLGGCAGGGGAGRAQPAGPLRLRAAQPSTTAWPRTPAAAALLLAHCSLALCHALQPAPPPPPPFLPPTPACPSSVLSRSGWSSGRAGRAGSPARACAWPGGPPLWPPSRCGRA